MAQLVIDIPDDKVADVLDAFAVQYNWNPGLGTKAQFARNKVAEYVKSIYVLQQAKVAANMAKTNASTIVIT